MSEPGYKSSKYILLTKKIFFENLIFKNPDYLEEVSEPGHERLDGDGPEVLQPQGEAELAGEGRQKVVHAQGLARVGAQQGSHLLTQDLAHLDQRQAENSLVTLVLHL